MKRPLPTCYGKRHSSEVAYYAPTDTLKSCEVLGYCRVEKGCNRRSFGDIQRPFAVYVENGRIVMPKDDTTRWKRLVRKWGMERPNDILEDVLTWYASKQGAGCTITVALRTKWLRLRFERSLFPAEKGATT